jgi:hypothetical protein
LRLFPDVSFNASNPPGPILLLRDFLLGFSICIDLFPTAKAPRSAVAFSWSISLVDGIWPNDFRDLGRVAGRVTSSREDMIARELDARIFVGRGFYQVFMKLVDRFVILESLSMWLLRVNKTKKSRPRRVVLIGSARGDEASLQCGLASNNCGLK